MWFIIFHPLHLSAVTFLMYIIGADMFFLQQHTVLAKKLVWFIMILTVLITPQQGFCDRVRYWKPVRPQLGGLPVAEKRHVQQHSKCIPSGTSSNGGFPIAMLVYRSVNNSGVVGNLRISFIIIASLNSQMEPISRLSDSTAEFLDIKYLNLCRAFVQGTVRIVFLFCVHVYKFRWDLGHNLEMIFPY